jgi:hypothetical protein
MFDFYEFLFMGEIPPVGDVRPAWSQRINLMIDATCTKDEAFDITNQCARMFLSGRGCLERSPNDELGDLKNNLYTELQRTKAVRPTAALDGDSAATAAAPSSPGPYGDATIATADAAALAASERELEGEDYYEAGV